MLVTAFMGPETAVLVGLLVFAVVRARSARFERSPSTARLAGWAALLVVGAYLLVNSGGILLLAARYFVRALLPLFPEPWDVRWWVYAGPIVGAVVGVVIAVVRMSRRASRPEVPVIPIVRRTWTSFAPRVDLVLAGVPLALLVLTCIIGGLASSAGPTGWYAVLLTPGGEGALSAGMTTFFGWAFGVPVLAAVVVLVPLAYALLRMTAVAPYLRPETVDAEIADRRIVSSAVLRVVAGAALFALGGAWMLIGGAGQSGPGLQILGSDAVVYPTGYSSFAPAFTVIGWLAQVFAFVLLLLTASGRRLSRHRRRATAITATAS